MTSNTRKRKKMTKAQRRRLRQRQQMIRRFGFLGVAAVICVVCLVMIPILNRPIDHQTSWYVEDGAMEIAAPPARSTSALTTAAGSPATEVVRTADIPAQSSELTTVPIVPSQPPQETPADTFSDEADDDSAQSLGPVSITITAAGDCTFGGCLKHDTYKVFKKYLDENGYDYFFANVRSLFEADDLTIINLEGPLTDVGTMTTKSGICFRGDPEWTAIMTGSSVELCNFANNHAMDMGEEGFNRTLKALDDAGIGYCAYQYVYHTTIKGVRITALGFDKWNNKQPEVVEAVQRERANCDLLIVNFHWGREMHYEPMSDQKKMGRAIVDAGADLVIGTHPHVYGGVELYKGKYICYSLGNFCFGGNTMPKDQRCMMFQQTFQIDTDGSVTDGGINVIPCLVSGDPKRNDFQPYILGEKAGTTLLKNIRRYSNLNDDTLWMTGSYPEQIGLVTRTAEVKPVVDEVQETLQQPSFQATVTTVDDDEPEIEDISDDQVNDGFALGTPNVQTDLAPSNGYDSSDVPRLGDSLSEAEIVALQQQMYLDQTSK